MTGSYPDDRSDLARMAEVPPASPIAARPAAQDEDDGPGSADPFDAEFRLVAILGTVAAIQALLIAALLIAWLR